MSQTTREKLGVLFPHLDGQQLAAAYERVQRYVRLVALASRKGASLTDYATGVSVNAGQVDPSTFKNTG